MDQIVQCATSNMRGAAGVVFVWHCDFRVSCGAIELLNVKMQQRIIENPDDPVEAHAVRAVQAVRHGTYRHRAPPRSALRNLPFLCSRPVK